MAAQVTSGSGLVFAKGEQWYTFISSRSDEVNFITSHLHFVESSSTGIHLPYKNQKIWCILSTNWKNSLSACFFFLKNKKSMSFDFLSWKANWTIHLSVNG